MADTDPGGVAGGLCGAAGGLCGVTHQEQAACLGREQSREDKRTLPCLVMAPHLTCGSPAHPVFSLMEQ